MLTIKVKDNESIDKALKRFKKQFGKTGTMQELRSRTFYKKPSVSKREERIKAAYREKMHAKYNY